MSKLRIFKSTMVGLQYIFAGTVGPDKQQAHGSIGGKAAPFKEGVYHTDHPDEIAELEREVKNRHPLIYIDPTNYEIDSEDLDPMIALKKKIRAELEEEMAAGRDMGASDQSKSGAGTGVGTSSSIAAMTGAPVMKVPGALASLANLKVGKPTV